MLTVLPMLAVLTSLPVTASGYSPSEKRTLQSAVSSTLYGQALDRYNRNCKEQATDTGLVVPDKHQQRLQNLLRQAVHTDNTELLLSADDKLTRQIKSTLITPKDCSDQAGIQSMLDNYEVALFSLEIALPLNKAIAASRPNTGPSKNDTEALINRSSAIALVSITDKQQLTAVQQANYLHLEYQSPFIFKVEQGWKNPTAAYIGMHKYIQQADLDKTAKQWLIFLDHNNHFIKALELNQAKDYLKALKEAQWRFDSLGNLQRF